MGFDFIFSLLRKMFFNIDKIIYGLIDDVYGLVIQLAGTSIFSTEMINAFAERIYAFIGIFMLFKVTISLITHVLNPDDFTDKEKGFTSIIKRIILSLCMVVLVPYVFAEAYQFQKLILTENTLVTLIFGTPPDTNGEAAQLAGTTYVDTAGKKMQFTLMNAFIHPNYEEFTITSSGTKDINLSACKELYVKDSNGNFVFRNRVGSDNKASRYYYALNPACFGEYDSMNDIYLDKYTGENGDETPGLYKAFNRDTDQTNMYQTYAQGVAQQNYDLMFRQDIVELSIDDKYVMDYKWLISTIAGVVTLYMLVVFCIDIAVRSVKLGFLQMIAPIPIISYVDPKSGKDGMFKKWTNMCVKTYLDLFIRLFALFFGIYIISLIGTFKDVMDGETISDGIVNVFLIIGVLIFVKKLPEILKETLGFEGGTFKDFKFNPLKRIEEDSIFGKQIIGASKRAGVIAASVPLVGAASFLTGNGLRGMGKAFAGGIKGEKFGKNFTDSYGAARAAHKRIKDRKADGVSGFDVLKENVYNATHARSRSEQVKTLQDQAKGIQSAYDRVKNQAIACDSQATTEIQDANGNWVTSESAKSINKRIEQLKKTTIDRSRYSANATGEAQYQAALKAQNAAIDKAEKELETRINALAQGKVRYAIKDASGTITGYGSGTGIASADKVIAETVGTIKSLKDSTNKLGNSLDSKFEEIKAADDDIVQIMKQAKGTVAQTESGKMSSYTDRAQYGNRNKKS